MSRSKLWRIECYNISLTSSSSRTGDNFFDYSFSLVKKSRPLEIVSSKYIYPADKLRKLGNDPKYRGKVKIVPDSQVTFAEY